MRFIVRSLLQRLLLESEIEADVDFWFENLKDLEEGANADFLAKENYRSVVRSAISAACEHTIYEGVDVELSTGVEHFSLTSTDQTNLFGKQAELSAGAEKCAYHRDADETGTKPCVYYPAADMQKNHCYCHGVCYLQHHILQ